MSNQERFMDDMHFCIEVLGMKDDDAIQEMYDQIEKFNVSSIRYFFDEFVFIPEEGNPADMFRLHDPDYLNIKELT